MSRMVWPTTHYHPEHKVPGYECPCCGDFRAWAEGRTECSKCGAHLRPGVKILTKDKFCGE